MNRLENIKMANYVLAEPESRANKIYFIVYLYQILGNTHTFLF